MTEQEAADIIAGAKATNPLWDTLARADQSQELCDYLVAARNIDPLAAVIQAGRIFRLAPQAAQLIDRSEDPLAAQSEEIDPLAPSGVRAWAIGEADPLAPKATAEIARIESGARRKPERDARLRPGMAVPGLLEAWMQAANLSDSDAAKILGFASRMTVYNMRHDKQRQVLAPQALFTIRVDLATRLAAVQACLALLDEYEV